MSDPEDPTLTAVMGERRHLLNLAYRLLGSLAEAEDAVQETYTRWFALSPEQRDAIRSPAAWLTTVASRLCLDLLGSARARRERYVGEWVPEPLPNSPEWSGLAVRAADNPADRVTLDESVTMAFLVTVESLTPAERVALILHDVFGYSFAEVADIVGRTPAACRQLASSARKRARDGRPPRTPLTDQAEIVRAFRRAWEARDIDALLALLDPDATAIADGGGRTTALPHPLTGARQIADHYLYLAERMSADITVTECTVNGQPGLVMRQNGTTRTVFAFHIATNRITSIWAIRNPAKLRHW